MIDLESKEVVIGKHFYDYDFEELELDILEREYVVIDGEEYPCYEKDEAYEDEYWYR